MSDLYPVPSRVSEGSPNPLNSLDAWRQISQEAQADPDAFWLNVTNDLIAWSTPPTLGLGGGFHSIQEGPLRWFEDGVLNVTESCIDRHLSTRGDKVALLWEGDEPDDIRRHPAAPPSSPGRATDRLSDQAGSW